MSNPLLVLFFQLGEGGGQSCCYYLPIQWLKALQRHTWQHCQPQQQSHPFPTDLQTWVSSDRSDHTVIDNSKLITLTDLQTWVQQWQIWPHSFTDLQTYVQQWQINNNSKVITLTDLQTRVQQWQIWPHSSDRSDHTPLLTCRPGYSSDRSDHTPLLTCRPGLGFMKGLYLC